MKVERDVPVPRQDGVKLMADVYRPNGLGVHPVLVRRTPHNRTGHVPANKVIALWGNAGKNDNMNTGPGCRGGQGVRSG